MIEAMARGLPCLGSNVGGIGELIPRYCLIPAGDAAALRSRIEEVAADAGWMTREAARNLAVARGYQDSALRERRRAFYSEVGRIARNAQALKPASLQADPTHG